MTRVQVRVVGLKFWGVLHEGMGKLNFAWNYQRPHLSFMNNHEKG